jgi:hypothetical protein
MQTKGGKYWDSISDEESDNELEEDVDLARYNQLLNVH